MSSRNQIPALANTENQRLRDALKQLVDSHSKTETRIKLCDECGELCERLTAQFWIDGEEEMFRVGLPFCPSCHPELISRARPIA
jgi:hypothetical protein